MRAQKELPGLVNTTYDQPERKVDFMSSAGARLDLQEIRYRIQSHVVFRFLHKDRAAFILSFLISAFKSRQRSDIPESELLSELSAFNDMVRLSAGDAEAISDARQSLDDWANDGYQVASKPDRIHRQS